jgi:hypothetical protein
MAFMAVMQSFDGIIADIVADLEDPWILLDYSCFVVRKERAQQLP